jgi:hypothetical protein
MRDRRRTLERTIEKHLVEEVERRGWQHRKLDRKKGDPDRLVLADEGYAVFFELKRPVGGRVDDAQVIRHEELRALGFRVCLCANEEDVDYALRAIDSFVGLRKLGV